MPPPLGSLPGFSSGSFLTALLVAAQMFVINSLPALSQSPPNQISLQTEGQCTSDLSLTFLTPGQAPSLSSLNNEHVMNWKNNM